MYCRFKEQEQNNYVCEMCGKSVRYTKDIRKVRITCHAKISQIADSIDIDLNELHKTWVIIAAYHKVNLTQAVVRQCLKEQTNVCIVDNSGDYVRIADELVLRPGRNLGWLSANNLAVGQISGANRFVLLNNDLVLSPNFISGLIQAEKATGCSIVAASYDGFWKAQNPGKFDARKYTPMDEHVPVGACDGTAVSIRSEVFQNAEFDKRHFGNFGWWAMTDLCIQAKKHGHTVCVTRLSYCNHYGQQTGREVHGSEYQQKAQREAEWGRYAKYGSSYKELADLLSLEPVTIYTAITGGRDLLQNPKTGYETKFICFTDADLESCSWEIRKIKDKHVDPRRLYKPIKCMPHKYGIQGTSIWVDASFIHLRSLQNLLWWAKKTDLAMYNRNEDRKVDCIYEEARRCIKTNLDSESVINAQMERYRPFHPEHFGLGWTGILVRRDTPVLRGFGEKWSREIEIGSKRDQLSMMPLLNFPWTWIPGSIRNNQFVKQVKVRPDRGRTDD